MNRKPHLVMFILCLSIGIWTFAQGNGQGHGPAAGPPAGAHLEHGAADHGPGDHGQKDHGQANKPAEPNRSAHSGKNAVGTRLRENPDLASKLQGMLPAGMNVEDASNGFKNFGQFVAAVHVSKNLGIPFDQLKGAVITNHMSLGDAIHALKPEVTEEARRLRLRRPRTRPRKIPKRYLESTG